MESINPPSSKWNHNDDVMLINAVEAGASLESLARGAVHFSRAYTLQEIKERWLCLLYDPTVSSEFIGHAAEFKPSTAPKGTQSANTKRKRDSVRGLYYDECRKHRRSLREMAAASIPQPVISNPVDADQQATVEGMMTSDPVLDSFGIELDAETSEMLDKLLNSFEADSTENGVNPFIGSKNHGFKYSDDEEENLRKFQGHVLGFGPCENLPFGNFGASGSFDERALSGLGFSSSSVAPLPFLGSDNDVSGPGPSNLFEGGERLTSGASAAQHCVNDGAEASRLGDSDATLLTEDYIAEFADRLLNLSDNEDTDAAGPLCQSYLETFTSLVSDNPDTCPNEPVKVSERDDLGASGSGPSQAQYNSARQPTSCSLPTSSAVGNRSPEKNRNGVIICTLNEEDPEIPDNDDVFLPFILPMPDDFWIWTPPPWFGENEPLIPFPPSYSGCSVNAPKQSEEPSTSKPKKKTVNRRVRFDLPKSNGAKPAAHYGEEHARRVSEMNAAVLSSIATQGNSLVMEQRRSAHKPIEPLIAAVENGSEAALFQWDPRQAHEGNGTRADEEETWAEGDFDVPCFSDVEAMILNADLVLDKCNLLDDPDVQQLQLDRTKRTLIRLEQAAESCSQRVIAAHGAFAILFGHFSWHFIRKPDVLIGRAIDGIEVDIDLGRLEMGTKVSRRQAVIKIGAHGTFMIKNIGKKGIYVNGVDVLVGRWHNLTNSCVIEIKGLDFIFKINQQLVQEHLNRKRSEAPK